MQIDENDWTKILDKAFEQCEFCFISELGVEELWPSRNGRGIYVILEKWDADIHGYAVEDEIQLLGGIATELIKKYPNFNLAVYYKIKNMRTTIIEYKIPEKIDSKASHHELPKESPAVPKIERHYSITLTELSAIMKRPPEYVYNVLLEKRLSVAKLTYANMTDLVLDHRLVKKRTKDGTTIKLLLNETPEGWTRAQKWIDKLIFAALYERVKEKATYKCQRCGEKAVVIHHIDGDHSNMTKENLVFLCNKCHYKQHKEAIEKRKK